MKKSRHGFIILTIIALVGCQQQKATEFVLVSEDGVKSICLLPEEADYVLLAVEDLINDIEKITDQKPQLIRDPNLCEDGCVIVGSMDVPNSSSFFESNFKEAADLQGKWEAYKVRGEGADLIIVGSDSRGTMFGVYHFMEDYLGVDPLYFWADREPERKETLSWKEVNIDQDSPTFKYRGWFINDEDLLTGWMESGGARNIDYPFYAEVVNPEAMEKAVEAMVRLRYNLIIPASFIDIFNEPERKLVEIASKRGVFLSMHHIEPLGVSAFTYFNYWKERGKDLKFSFYSHPEELKQIWRVYAEEWSQFPNVIWQIGLRGIADRPMWLADDAIPQSDRERGALISQAMQEQMDIIHSVDDRKEIPVTTTLWMEGSELNEKGFLTFPEGVSVIFSDNSPGWMMQADFFNMERTPERKYGIYYHHQLWGTGPHLAQAVPPSKTHEILAEAVRHDSNDYAIFNISNIREFVLGLKATSEMLYDFEAFDVYEFWQNWCEDRFGPAADEAQVAYQKFFDSYQMHEESNGPILLDGQIKRKGLGLLSALKKQIQQPLEYQKEIDDAYGNIASEDLPWLNRHLADPRMGDITFRELKAKTQDQSEGVRQAIKLTENAILKSTPAGKRFLEENLLSQAMILDGLTDWMNHISLAVEAENRSDAEKSTYHLLQAKEAFGKIKSGQQLALRGEKWENWYAGETKMNLKNMEKATQDVLEASQSRVLENGR